MNNSWVNESRINPTLFMFMFCGGLSASAHLKLSEWVGSKSGTVSKAQDQLRLHAWPDRKNFVQEQAARAQGSQRQPAATRAGKRGETPGGAGGARASRRPAAATTATTMRI